MNQNVLEHTSIFHAVASVCAELGLEHTLIRVPNLTKDGDPVGSIIITGSSEDTVVFWNMTTGTDWENNWIFIARNEYYMQLHGDQTLLFGAVLRGTMGLDLSPHDNYIDEIQDLISCLPNRRPTSICPGYLSAQGL